jgi:hypothetical protein
VLWVWSASVHTSKASCIVAAATTVAPVVMCVREGVCVWLVYDLDLAYMASSAVAIVTAFSALLSLSAAAAAAAAVNDVSSAA